MNMNILNVIIPIYSHSHGGGDPKVFLAMLIAANFLMAIAALILYYIYRKDKKQLIEALWGESICDIFCPSLLMIFFTIVNGIAVFVGLMFLIFKML